MGCGSSKAALAAAAEEQRRVEEEHEAARRAVRAAEARAEAERTAAELAAKAKAEAARLAVEAAAKAEAERKERERARAEEARRRVEEARRRLAEARRRAVEAAVIVAEVTRREPVLVRQLSQKLRGMQQSNSAAMGLLLTRPPTAAAGPEPYRFGPASRPGRSRPGSTASHVAASRPQTGASSSRPPDSLSRPSSSLV